MVEDRNNTHFRKLLARFDLETDYLYFSNKATLYRGLAHSNPFPKTVFGLDEALELDSELVVVKHPRLHAQKGIKIVKKSELHDVKPLRDQMFQRFISNPMLLQDEFKFTMRCYLLYDYSSKRWYLYKKGKLYHCIDPFSDHTPSSMITSGYIPEHLIERFPYTFEELEEQELGKETFDKVWDSVVACVKVFTDYIVIRTRPDHDTYKKCLFLGLDIELDSDFKAWMIDVNPGPDMEYKNETDRKLKDGLVDDCMKIIDEGIVSDNFLRM